MQPPLKGSAGSTQPHPDASEPPAGAASVSALAARVLADGEDRVAELKRLYDSGEYTAPAGAVAARIIDETVRS